MVKGVRFSGIASGIKADGLDLGLVVFDEPVPHGALYTRNKVKAGHILYNRKGPRKEVRALLVNSGCANACTGEGGIGDLATIAKEWPAASIYAKRGPLCLHRGHRQAASRQDRPCGLAASRRGLKRGASRRLCPRHNDHRHLPEGRGGAHARRRGLHRRGRREGRGDDEPPLCDHACLRLHRLPARLRQAQAAPAHTRQGDIRAHQRRRRHEHERHGHALLDGARPLRKPGRPRSGRSSAGS